MAAKMLTAKMLQCIYY